MPFPIFNLLNCVVSLEKEVQPIQSAESMGRKKPSSFSQCLRTGAMRYKTEYIRIIRVLTHSTTSKDWIPNFTSSKSLNSFCKRPFRLWFANFQSHLILSQRISSHQIKNKSIKNVKLFVARLKQKQQKSIFSFTTANYCYYSHRSLVNVWKVTKYAPANHKTTPVTTGFLRLLYHFNFNVQLESHGCKVTQWKWV